jgi:ATP-dependent Clp protease ATP-binding subunit ClpA
MKQAKTGGHHEIVPAHLLLGVLDVPEGLGARALTAQGLDLDAVRAAARAGLPAAPTEGEEPVLIPYDAASRKVLELTFREALRLNQQEVGTAHILLALLEEREATLAGLQVTKDAVDAFLSSAEGSSAEGEESLGKP